MISESKVSQALLIATGLACRRGHDTLFDNLSFEILPGQIIWLRGQNGRGKTSLLRQIVGLAQPEKGLLTWSKPDLVYIGHTNALKVDLSALEALRFLVQLRNRPCTPTLLNRALTRMALGHRAHILVRALSQGQRRRVAMARLVLEDSASLWVLDEPFESLDPQGIDVVNNLMLEHVGRGGSIILTSHLALTMNGASVQTLDLAAAQSS